MIEVARRYRFRGRHHVPGLPEPWCTPHDHEYTVEVVARGEAPIVIDTDVIDEAWAAIKPRGSHRVDMDVAYGPENTTVEALAQRYLDDFRRELSSFDVSRVTVWEDEGRWGAAFRLIW